MALSMKNIRVRLCFDEPPTYYPRMVWYLVDLESCRFVSDLESNIKKRFSLSRYTHVHLYVDEYLLPSRERIGVVRENDVIRVKQEVFCFEEGKAETDIKKKKKKKRKPSSTSHWQNGCDNASDSMPSSSMNNSSDERRTVNDKKAKRKRKRDLVDGSDAGSRSTSAKRVQRMETEPSEERNTTKRFSKEDDKKRKNLTKQQIKTPPVEARRREKVKERKCRSEDRTVQTRSRLDSEITMQTLNLKKGVTVRKNNNTSTDNHIRFESDSESESDTDSTGNGIEGNIHKDKDSTSNADSEVKSKTKANEVVQNSVPEKQQSVAHSSSSSSSSSSSDSSSTSSSNESDSDSEEVANVCEPETQQVITVVGSNTADEQTGTDTLTESSKEDKPATLNNQNRKRPQRRNQRWKLSKEQQLNDKLTNVSYIIENPSDVGDSWSGYHRGQSSHPEPPPPPPPQLLAPPRDYDKLQALHGPPRVGDKIAYKILELSSSYTPVVSEYKEGTVTDFHPVSQELGIEITHDPSACEQMMPGKFDLMLENEDEQDGGEDKPMENDIVATNKVTVSWTSLLEPKLIT